MLSRRQAICLSASAAGGLMTSSVARAAARQTFVLAHGSWHGGWCWKRVGELLAAEGHRVYAQSYTGMGERAHLLSKDITIDTFVNDVVGIIESEELADVVLVGHSFAGIPITGVADRMPNRLKHLIYLDSVVLEPNTSAFSVYPPAEVDARIKLAEAATGGLAVPVPATIPTVWGLAEGSDDYAWVKRRLSPHPLRTYTSPLNLKGPVGNNVPRTYVACTQPAHPALVASKALVKSLPGWRWEDFPGPHDSMITHPKAVAALLVKTAQV